MHNDPLQTAGKTAPALAMLSFEHPLNERMRMFLRLEFLFAKLAWFMNRESQWESRATVDTLLEILNLFNRGDIKTELVKELERLIANMEKLRQRENVDHDVLRSLTGRLKDHYNLLHGTTGNGIDILRQNEMIKSIIQRSPMPGGTSHVDLPNYYFWLQRPAARRLEDQQAWFATLAPLRSAVELVLQLVRQSSEPVNEIAVDGNFTKALDADLSWQMIRISLPPEEGCICEVSGSKHRASIRFLDAAVEERPRPVGRDIRFQLSCCIL